jgi:hypothetical protein
MVRAIAVSSPASAMRRDQQIDLDTLLGAFGGIVRAAEPQLRSPAVLGWRLGTEPTVLTLPRGESRS